MNDKAAAPGAVDAGAAKGAMNARATRPALRVRSMMNTPGTGTRWDRAHAGRRWRFASASDASIAVLALAFLILSNPWSHPHRAGRRERVRNECQSRVVIAAKQARRRARASRLPPARSRRRARAARALAGDCAARARS